MLTTMPYLARSRVRPYHSERIDTPIIAHFRRISAHFSNTPKKVYHTPTPNLRGTPLIPNARKYGVKGVEKNIEFFCENGKNGLMRSYRRVEGSTLRPWGLGDGFTVFSSEGLQTPSRGCCGC